ncbi:MAG: dynamin family protein, partial [Acidimicrobiales bacterium]
MTDTSSTNLIERASALVAVTSKAASAYQRPDLAGRLGEAATRLGEADLTALVVGEFKQGKSTLVNSLLNIPLCPVDDDVATVVPTIVRHGESASAAVLLEPPSEPERPPVDLTRIEVDTGLKPDPVAKPIELGEIAGYASEAGNPNNVRGVRAVQIAVPRRLLGTGLALIDTPGVGGLESIHGAATTAVLGMAEVVVFVSDASQELTEPETSFLRQAVDRCPNVVCVLTKVDLYPDWRRIA